MKKIIYIISTLIFLFSNTVFASSNIAEQTLTNDLKMQKHIDKVGFKLLNANKIDKRIVFLYKTKQDKIKIEPGLTKRQIIAYQDYIQYAENDDEIAAYLAPDICKAAQSYIGPWKGFVSAVQIKFAAKKYEIMFDKQSVDYLVNAGYNPLAVITFMNKAYVQKRFDKISNHNLTSKRLANVYEYIYFQYPQFLKNNEYLYKDSYQNFLLTSTENRKKLEQQIKTGHRGKINYE